MENPLQSNQNQLILAGMELVHQRLIEFKRKVNSELIIYRDNKIVRIKP